MQNYNYKIIPLENRRDIQFPISLRSYMILSTQTTFDLLNSHVVKLYSQFSSLYIHRLVLSLTFTSNET